MNRHKENFIRAHEALITEHMDRYGGDWSNAYDATADGAYQKMLDDYAAQADALKEKDK